MSQPSRDTVSYSVFDTTPGYIPEFLTGFVLLDVALRNMSLIMISELSLTKLNQLGGFFIFMSVWANQYLPKLNATTTKEAVLAQGFFKFRNLNSK